MPKANRLYFMLHVGKFWRKEDGICDPMAVAFRVKLFTDGCLQSWSRQLSTVAVKAGVWREEEQIAGELSFGGRGEGGGGCIFSVCPEGRLQGHRTTVLVLV